MKYFDHGLYAVWRRNRLKGILHHYGDDHFRGKTLLEVGAGNGDFGQMFADLGAHVTSYEGRPENFHDLKAKYPDRPVQLVDLDAEPITDSFDIILNVGLIYHLVNFEKHLRSCMRHCREMILETEVIDLDRQGWWVEREDAANLGASIYGYGSRASICFIEKILAEGNFTWQRPRHPGEMNTPPWIYDWSPGNKGLIDGVGMRAMWFCSSAMA